MIQVNPFPSAHAGMSISMMISGRDYYVNKFVHSEDF
jgi:hypothetical protein